MKTYEFTLPWPPTSNHFHQPVVMRKGRKVYARNVTSKDVKKYQKEVKRIMDELGLSGEMISQDVVVSITMHPKTNHKFDRSNFLKAYEDALVKCGFFEDDHWIDYGYIRKGEKVAGGKLVIKVEVK
ncbi:RusA-like Holliday junction resolvase [Vibrio phage PVA1]|uniref:RusA-like Holliday junction resolvase n=1 Tax=Vibrio phage PVA1 TaxID=1461743 RepID=UPI0003F1E2D3|nr:RusA-like Holliday junction resolvase [Vibrio phage PVA1]AHJ87866.1 cossover junction endodeoxyribonuclease rusA [Vibrio phage PVA1]